MTSRDFCYWLQGFFEIATLDEGSWLDEEQVDKVKKHLNLVFIHEIDPSMGNANHQQLLNETHGQFDLSNTMVRC
jgi:hypothetical protein